MSRNRTNLNRVVRVESRRRKVLSPPVADEVRRLRLASVAAEQISQLDGVPALAAVGPSPDF